MERLKDYWWKIAAVLLIIYGIIGGYTVSLPNIPGEDTSHLRNIFYHVGMWFAMLAALIFSFIYSVKHLRTFAIKYDIAALKAVQTAMLFGVLGLVTGMIWAKYAWGDFWINDPKLNGTAISLVVYFAYLVLRTSINDINKKARIAAVYNIFAFMIYLLFVLILPRIADQSIHPGNRDGNPVLPMDLDPAMRWVFYPAMAGWILLGVWIMQIKIKIGSVNYKLLNKS
ncbi:MAG: cytochrome c biogenesis protein CcsA [Bacteroidales bacterium]|nr:cytochrome c biogenesis protein CcsA [Bacteroidales bacterium]